MNVSSPVGQSPRFGPLSTANVTGKSSTPIKSSATSPEQQKHSTVEQSLANQAQSGIVIDEKAVALFEQQQHAKLNSNYSGSLNQDQPSSKNETAVASYQAVDNLAQRESVQQMFGVDLFA